MAENEQNRPLKVSHFAITALKALFLFPSGARGGKLTQLELDRLFSDLCIYIRRGEKVEADTQIRIAENGVIRRLNPVGEDALSPREIEDRARETYGLEETDTGTRAWYLLGKITKGKKGKKSSDRRSNQYQGESDRRIQASARPEKRPVERRPKPLCVPIVSMVAFSIL